MSLLHVVAMPAVVRAGWVGLTAVATFVAGTRSTPCETHRLPHGAAMTSAPRHATHAGAGIHRYVMSTHTRARLQIQAQQRAEEALARATTRLQRERIALATTPRALTGVNDVSAGPTRAELDALAALSASAQRDGFAVPPVPAAPVVAPAPPAPEPSVAHVDSPASTLAERSVRVLAAIAVFLLGMA